MEQLGVVCDAVVIPVGGGGLLAGMAIILKHFSPDVEVIVSSFQVCEPEHVSTCTCVCIIMNIYKEICAGSVCT